MTYFQLTARRIFAPRNLVNRDVKLVIGFSRGKGKGGAHLLTTNISLHSCPCSPQLLFKGTMRKSTRGPTTRDTMSLYNTRYRWFSQDNHPLLLLASSVPDIKDEIVNHDNILDDNIEDENPPKPIDNKMPVILDSTQNIKKYYRKRYGMELDSSSIETTGINFVRSHTVTKEDTSCAEATLKLSHAAWTAVFTCPVTSKIFKSGTLRADSSLLSFEHEHGNSTIFYSKKTHAIAAANARALDTFRYESDGIIEPRLCNEDPSVVGIDSDDLIDNCLLSQQPIPIQPNAEVDKSLQLPDVDEIKLSAKEVEKLDEAQKIGGTEKIDDKEKTEQTSEVDTRDEGVALKEGADLDDGSVEEGMIVTAVPIATWNRRASDLILEAAFESAFESFNRIPSLVNDRMPLGVNPEQRLKMEIDLANGWAENQLQSQGANLKYGRGRFANANFTLQTVKTGKAILRNLAEHNQSTIIPVSKIGVERAALLVLSILQEACMENGMQPLDGDVYALLLKCIEGKDAIEIASKAEEMIAAMEQGEVMNKSILPKPNVETYNAYIQLRAQCGNCRDTSFKNDFQFNRVSFLSQLSSRSYPPIIPTESDETDFSLCRLYIKRMNELAEATGDETLRPDTLVYNAPLRWYGGSQFRKSRPYARCIPADDFDLIFNQSPSALINTNDNEDSVTLNAAQAWMQEMIDSKDNRIQPNIETYEAVIQAWIRLGTKFGLEQAYGIAMRLLEQQPNVSVCPRLLTFRPIVIALALSKNPDNVSKIQQLVNKLEVAGGTSPDLRPDARMYQYLIASHVYTQVEFLKSQPDTKLSSIESADFGSLNSSADACEQILSHIFANLLTDTAANTWFVEVSPFEHSILACRNAALAAIVAACKNERRPADFEALDLAVERMMRVHRFFEDTVLAVYKSDVSFNGKRRNPLTLQLKHLLAFSYRVHSAIVISLENVIKLSNDSQLPPSSLSFLFNSLLTVESIFRKSIEFNFLVDKDNEILSSKAPRRAPYDKRQRGREADNDVSDITPLVFCESDLFPHGHCSSANRLMFPDQLFLSDSRTQELIPDWTRLAFTGRVLEFVQALVAYDDSGNFRSKHRGDLLRLLGLVEDSLTLDALLTPQEGEGEDLRKRKCSVENETVEKKKIRTTVDQLREKIDIPKRLNFHDSSLPTPSSSKETKSKTHSPLHLDFC